MPASVTMKDDTPIRVTHQPCHAPITKPTLREIATDSHGLTPYLTVSSATTTPTSATAEPTERSKLRVTISITALIAASETIAVCSARRTMLRWVRNVPLVAMLKNTQITANTAISVESRKDRLLRSLASGERTEMAISPLASVTMRDIWDPRPI